MTAAEIERWLLERLGASDANASFAEHGVDSVDAVSITVELEERLGRRLSPALAWEHPTIAALARHVAQADAPPAHVPGGPDGDAPLSHGQRALWFLRELAPDSSAYNVGGALRLATPIAPAALERALVALAARHVSLRTIYPLVDGEPVQRLAEAPALQRRTLPGPGPGPGPDLPAALADEAARPFDLQRGPVWRAVLFAPAGGASVLLLAFHHVAVDLWSLAVLVDELGALLAGTPLGAAPPADPRALARAQRERLAGPDGARLEAFWRAQVEGALAPLALPLDRPRPAAQSFRGAAVPFRLSAETTRAVHALARAERVTPHAVLLAAFEALLVRYTGQEDFLVGSPALGRNGADAAGVVGYFVNPLPLRARVGGDPTGRELVRRVDETTRAALAHQDLPFPLLVERLQLPRDPSRSPLFQAMFVLEKPQRGGEALARLVAGLPGEVALGSLRVEAVAVPLRSTPVELTLTMIEADGAFGGWLQYATDLWDEATVARMVDHFGRMVAGIARTPDEPVGALAILGDAERQRVTEWNDTARPEAPVATAHELFARQARERPERVAVVWEQERMSYGALDAAAEAFAERLRGAGVGRGSIVGLYLERRPALLVGIFGILKAGGAYLPLDPAYPKDRLGFIVKDAGARVIVTERRLAPTLPEGHGATLVLVDAADSSVPESRLADLPSAVAGVGGHISREPSGPEDLCYVIYTSGSTGRPKGVAIRHASVANLAWHWNTLFSPDDLARVCFWTTVSFDGSAFEIFVPLCFGGAVVLVDTLLSLPRAPAGAEVTLINSVPSAMAELARAGGLPAALRAVTLGGEPLPMTLAEELLARPLVRKVINVYGPTEDTVHSTTWPAAPGEPAKIGRPIANKQAYVLDPRLALAPIGVAGELHLGGRGLARGYLNQPELTAARFIDHPTLGRLYKTGDLARALPDGNLEFLGRVDQQVKIRGFRIELGEIEHVLGAHPHVSECCALAREDTPGDKRLVAYLVPRAGAARPTPAALRAHLTHTLPDYMVPRTFVLLDALPLTPNGKVDRRALPPPVREPTAAVPPRTADETVLCALYKELLGLPAVGATDDFFELGGHSLLAVRLVDAIQRRFAVELPVSTLFAGATVERLAAQIRAAAPPRTTLVEITAGDPRLPPFFCVHPAGGNVLSYLELARLLPDRRPFFGLEAPTPPVDDVPRLAALHLDALPQPPRLLGGWSFGGLVAYEMARQLADRGRAPERLILLDCAAPGFLPDEYAGEAVRRELAELPAGAHDTFHAAVRAGRAYPPAPYPGALVLIRAGHATPDPTLGWGALAAAVTTHVVPGDHHSMFRRPHVAALAAVLAAALAP